MPSDSSQSLDVRWKQRFNNFIPAYAQLKSAVELSQKRALTELEKQGLIQAFEFTHELAWNVQKDFLQHQGLGPLYGSKDTAREAFNKGLIENGEAWMDMIRSRNQTSHTYQKLVADDITAKIIDIYFNLLTQFLKKMGEIADK